MTRRRFGLAFAGLIAAASLSALLIELDLSLTGSLAEGHSLAEALYLHFRFFTILTSWGLVGLLAATLVQGWRDAPLPHASLYGACLVYIAVVGATYEILLRKTGLRHDLDFFTDLVMHDVVPTFYLAFWLGFAPKTGLTSRHALHWLAFPTAYFTATLVFGPLGAGYPYFFVDAARFGYRAVATNAVLFLAVFFGLGLGTVLLSRVVPAGLDTREPLVK